MRRGPVEVFGCYLIYEQLGMGGMARVDRAEIAPSGPGSDGFHRPVALKRMLPHVASHEEMVQAFVREARLASFLRHANVAQIYEFGKVDTVHFIAMELVTGPTLREVLKHCAHATGPMPIPIALNILNQICDALDYAHNLRDEAGQPLGIVHRDVSPSNIILDEAGVAKLIDFGVAKASAAGMQTQSGLLKGKFGYMAPEYLLGEIDARADLFAVGVIAHELLTNRPLFSVPDDIETMRRMRAMPLQPPSQSNPKVPPEIDDIVMTALSRDPDGRWQHATALRTALTTLTRRLGLVCTNQQVVEWITWALEQDNGQDNGPSEPSVQIEEPTKSERPPTSTPRGTPRQSHPPDASLTMEDATELHLDDDGLSLNDATELHLGDDGPSLSDATELRLPGESPMLNDATELQLVEPGRPRAAPRARSVGPLEAALPLLEEHDRYEQHNATLLDGGAALRSRVAAMVRRPLAPLGPAPVPAASRPPPRPPSVPPLGSPQALPWPQGLLPSQPLPLPLPHHPRRATTAPPPPPAEPAPERRTGSIAIVVLVLLAAAIAGGGVYLLLA